MGWSTNKNATKPDSKIIVTKDTDVYAIWDTGGPNIKLIGILKDKDGKWKAFVNGKVDTTYTGVASCSDGDLYFKKGVHDTTFSGVAQSPTTKKWYIVTKGKATQSFNSKAEAEGNRKAADGTAVGKGAGAVAAEKAITSVKSDNDQKGSAYSVLQLKSAKQAKSSIALSWKKANGAKKYVIYGNACGKNNKMKKLKTLTKNSYTVKKIGKKNLKKGTYYKFIVVALDKNNKVISTSKIIHAATTGGKVGNHKSVTVKAKVDKNGKAIKTEKVLTQTVLKKGKSVTLKATTTPASKKLTVKKHRTVAYESSNTKVATVNAKGKITAKAKGSCYIYAYAQNGVYKRIKITVK